MKFKTVHLIWIAGYPSVAHSSKPRELMPTRVFFPSMSQSNGPPKSPLQVSLPPATTWLPYWFCWVANRPDQDSARDSPLSALKYFFIIEKMWHWKKNPRIFLFGRILSDPWTWCYGSDNTADFIVIKFFPIWVLLTSFSSKKIQSNWLQYSCPVIVVRITSPSNIPAPSTFIVFNICIVS